MMQSKAEQSRFDAESLIVNLQSAAESDRDRFARQLHDEVAGLIVAALMDISFVSERAVAADASVSLQLERARTTLKSAIDVTRRMVEEMRPSMLDNFGLFTALRWELKRFGADGRFDYSESLPPGEPAIAREAAIVLFRIAQYALSRVDRRPVQQGESRPALVDLRVHLEADSISLSVATSAVLSDADEVALTALRYRLQALGGSLELAALPAGGSVLIAQAPKSCS
jgi:signal transduction histidine kinase